MVWRLAWIFKSNEVYSIILFIKSIISPFLIVWNHYYHLAENNDILLVGKTLLHGGVLMWIMKVLLISRYVNQQEAGQVISYIGLKNMLYYLTFLISYDVKIISQLHKCNKNFSLWRQRVFWKLQIKNSIIYFPVVFK